MMHVLKQPGGGKMVLLTGRAAESIVDNFKRNPPPFDCLTYNPVMAYSGQTKVSEPLFNPDDGAIFDRLEREVQHYQRLEAAKSTLLDEQIRENTQYREALRTQREAHDRDLQHAGTAIENLRAELVTLGEQMRALKAAGKPARKPRKLAAKPAHKALPSANGSHKRKEK